jgi:hypothetical protein
MVIYKKHFKVFIGSLKIDYKFEKNGNLIKRIVYL